MPIPSLYLDTSVIGGYFDDEWQEATRELWRQMEAGHWRFVTSNVTAQEIEGAPRDVSELFQRTFPPDMLFQISDETKSLAEAYLHQGIVTAKYSDDALHVAICTVARVQFLVSWNFRHLVNVRREAGFNTVNLLRGYPSIRIVNPLELIHGNQKEEI